MTTTHEQWLADNTGYCPSLRARMTPAACRAIRKRSSAQSFAAGFDTPPQCKTCTGIRAAGQAAAPAPISTINMEAPMFPQQPPKITLTRPVTVGTIAAALGIPQKTVHNARFYSKHGTPSTKGSAGRVERTLRENGLTWADVGMGKKAAQAAEAAVGAEEAEAKLYEFPSGFEVETSCADTQRPLSVATENEENVALPLCPVCGKQLSPTTGDNVFLLCLNDFCGVQGMEGHPAHWEFLRQKFSASLSVVPLDDLRSALAEYQGRRCE